MAIFVIVHGAWSGAHAWHKVRPLLRAAGHEVFTPALTGLGERAHLLHPGISLNTHIQDVIGVLEYEDLQQVILIGHSSGGVVITGVADRVPQRLSQLIYLDAEVPQDGQSEYDLLLPEDRAMYEEWTRTRGDGWRVPPPVPEPIPDDMHADMRWAVSRMVPHPARALSDALKLTNPEPSIVPRTYIYCTAGKDGQPVPAHVERARSNPDWRYRELAAGHGAHVTAPAELTHLLLELILE